MHFNRCSCRHNMWLVAFSQGTATLPFFLRNYYALQKIADGDASGECVRAWKMECGLRNLNNSGMTLTSDRLQGDLQPAITITMHRQVLRVRQVAPSDPHILNQNYWLSVSDIYNLLYMYQSTF